MKEGWKYTTIGESCNINYGTRVVRSKDGGTIYDVYGGGGATFKMDTYNREDCLVVARFAMSKQCTRYVKGKFFLNDSGLTVSPKDGSYLSQTLLDKILLALNDTIYSFGRGSAQRNLNIKEFSTMKIAYPINLAEQEKFVSLLDAEFAKIDTIKANAEKQLQDAKALFQSALKDYLTPKEGWEEKTLKEIGKTQTGCTPSMSKKEFYNEEYMPFIKPSEINYDGLGGINYNTQMLSKLGAENGRVFQPHSIFMVCIGATISKLGISEREISCNQQINVLTPKDLYHSKFIYYAMLNPTFINLVKKEGTSAQATLPIISKGKWEQLKITVPQYTDQLQIAEQLDKISTKIQSLQSNFDTTVTLCNDLKQSILKDIFG